MSDIYVAYFATFSVVAGTTFPFVTEAINRWFDLQGKVLKSIVSWVVPVAIMYVGWGLGNFFDGSFLQDLVWWKPAVFGAWAGLLSNVCWNDVPWLKDAVNNFFEWLLNKNSTD